LRICIGADHAGFPLKEAVRDHLSAAGHEVSDVGAFSEDSVDYPLVAEQVGRAVGEGSADIGVLVCGTGLGMAIAANKVRGVRAVQVNTPEFASMARRHNDANLITLAGRSISAADAFATVDAFLSADFEGGRHQRRVDQISAIEEAQICSMDLTLKREA
jgi:ribose 5-phosphate isomerase B